MINALKTKNHSTQTPISRLLRMLPVTAFFNRQWWLSTILVMAAIVVMVRLGFWQLDRLDQRRARNAEVTRQLALPPLLLNDMEEFPADLTRLKNRLAETAGEYDFSRQVALKHQNRMGSPGIHLITPLVFNNGTAAVLVDRGWIPQAQASPDQWAQFDEPAQATVTGFIVLSEIPAQHVAGAVQPAQGFNSSEVTPQSEWYRVDIAAIQAQLPYHLLPIYIRQSPPNGNTAEYPYRSEPNIQLSDGPHLGYAIQWYIFALILGIGYVRYVRKQVNKEQERKEIT